HGRLRDEIDRMWADIQRREASRLRPLSEASPSVQAILRLDQLYWLCDHQTEDELRSHAQTIADLALSTIWASHAHAWPNLVSDAIRPDFEASRKLLFIS